MTRSLKGKLILSYLVVALVTVLAVSLVIWLTSGQSLMNLVVEQQTASLAEAAETYYQSNQTWKGFAEYFFQIEHSNPEIGLENSSQAAPPKREIRGVLGLVDLQQRALIPAFGYEVGQRIPDAMLKDAIAVNVDGETIAWILPDKKMQFNLNPQEELFMRRITLAVSLAALAGVILAVTMGFLLAGNLLKPIHRLTKASKSLASGQLGQKVPVTSDDELGELTSTFNKMSEDLEYADEQRKRLTADITHDLSTPLQVISGYMEMLEGGEVQLTPARIEVIKKEIEHLRSLVGDLATLTQVETKTLVMQFQPLSAIDLLERLYETFNPIAAQKGIDMVFKVEPDLPLIYADENRMMQVLKNLTENALRYTPPGGQIRLKASANPSLVVLTFSDDGQGIAREDLPYVFERFYRADKARNANHGKMGLGLSICKALVEVQGGTIQVQSEGSGKGTTFVLSFPIKQED